MPGRYIEDVIDETNRKLGIIEQCLRQSMAPGVMMQTQYMHAVLLRDLEGLEAKLAGKGRYEYARRP